MTTLMWRHKKRGSVYIEVGTTELQSSAGPVPEGTQITTYIGLDDGKAWCRPSAEFHDGRFESLIDHDQSETWVAIVRSVVDQAALRGFIVTVDQLPLLPLAMGNHETVVSVRPSRKPRIKVFNIDEVEWWAGESLESCLAEARKQTGEAYDDVDEHYEMTDEAMQRLKFDDGGVTRTFAEELALAIQRGTKFPCHFAATDW